MEREIPRYSETVACACASPLIVRPGMLCRIQSRRRLSFPQSNSAQHLIISTDIDDCAGGDALAGSDPLESEVGRNEGPQILSNPRAASDAGPISRILYDVAAADGHSSRPPITERLQRPTRRLGASSRNAPGVATRNPFLFGLAPCGVCHAPCIAARAVRSYRTFSPLPQVALRRFVLCGTFRQTSLNSSSRTLSGTLLCGVRTFLSFLVRPGMPRRSQEDSDHPVQHQLTPL
jgi:hypothetical protein